MVGGRGWQWGTATGDIGIFLAHDTSREYDIGCPHPARRRRRARVPRRETRGNAVARRAGGLVDKKSQVKMSKI